MTQYLGLSRRERLTLQQLKLVEWAEKYSTADGTVTSEDQAQENGGRDSLPGTWTLTEGIQLAPWQRDACHAWFAAGMRGTIKVVTGAGKTVVALAIAERLQREDPDLRVAIVVPTIVLMNQWVEVFRERSNLPECAVGRMGGGHSESFDETRRVVVAVLASARKELPAMAKSLGIGQHLLLIVDECHRAGAPAMSAVLETGRGYSLGLSATPERDDLTEEASLNEYNASKLGIQIGPIVYEMTYAEAIRLGVLPPFEIHHIGVDLSPEEDGRYQALSRSIADARRELQAASPTARKLSGGQLLAWASKVGTRGPSDITAIAYRFMNDTSRRKQLLYEAGQRVAAAQQLVKEALEDRDAARVILFHESISEVVRLFGLLREEGLPVVMEHSKLPPDLREGTLDLFRSGDAQVVVSARSLIEGFNVPEADLGIIVASSSSPRQRIQSIGRVLRVHRDGTGDHKASRVCVLYVRQTVDEQIYERENWEELIGADRNRYFYRDALGEVNEVYNPPRSPLPDEDAIDLSRLAFGDEYPGGYVGDELTTDTHGNVTNLEGTIAANPQEVPETVRRLKGQYGRFRITPKKAAILVLAQDTTRVWKTLYGGILGEPFDFAREPMIPDNISVEELFPGDHYPGPVTPSQEFRYRARAGGRIAKRVRGGEVYAGGTQAERLLATVNEVRRNHRGLTKVHVNNLGHAFWVEGGIPRFLVSLDGDLEFYSDG